MTRSNLSRHILRWLIWYVPQVLCCLGLGVFLTLLFMGLV